ncbi:MAG: C1 family peptidase [Alloprevotella sp.]|nr:C1 family peptidase [Alloprevotella sp.]
MKQLSRIFLVLVCTALVHSSLYAQNGGIDAAALARISQQGATSTQADRALRNALAATSINQLATTADNPTAPNTYFSNEAPSRGITDQKSSGRCWLFSGLNVLRAEMIRNYKLGDFRFSQAYLFFFDQLEKSNLFLQTILDTAPLPDDDRLVDLLFDHPIGDGGTFCGVQSLVSKYGVVPSEVFPESFAANNTSKMSQIISLKLREFGLELRRMSAEKKKPAVLQKRKEEQLAEIYHILSICLGTPPTSFTYTLRDNSGKALSTDTYTPMSFYQKFIHKDLANGYVMMMNDPSRPYYKMYSVKLDRHVYDAPDWTFLNLPMDDIKKVAIRSLQDSTRLYMSCDVGKYYDSKTGTCDLKNFDYESLFATTFPMSKAERIKTHASASSHAMTFCGVDLDANGKPLKWKVENSWGPTSGSQGHLIMTDEWLDEYLFRLVAERKYVGDDLLRLTNQKPIELPAWDPLF